MILSLVTGVAAHRLDEYLQATTISIEKHRVQAQIRLTPGVAVFPSVMSTIDTDHDGVISIGEMRAYAGRVLSDVSLAADGDRLKPKLISMAFPTTAELKDGRGEIRIDFAADVPRDTPEHKLAFENHHQAATAAYLVNCLVPQDPDIRITAQNRNYEQSQYQVEYNRGGMPARLSLAWWSDGGVWLGSVAMLLLARLTVLWRKQRRSL